MEPWLADPFANEPGFAKSLLRDEAEPEEFYADARSVIEAGGPPPALNGFSFGFAPGPDANMIEFAFHPALNPSSPAFARGPYDRRSPGS